MHIRILGTKICAYRLSRAKSSGYWQKKKGDFAPMTSYDIITCANVDLEPEENLTQVVNFVFLKRVAIINLYFSRADWPIPLSAEMTIPK